MNFNSFQPSSSGVADLKKAFETARGRRLAVGDYALLFVDEIHRFNRAQQDGFLPFVEEGLVTLGGATTENPSFELNGALLSRCQVFVLKRLDDEAMQSLLAKAEAFEKRDLPLTPEARAAMIAMADGDGRYVLTLAETLFNIAAPKPFSTTELAGVLQKRSPAYDKDREEHYNLISALHKSVRGSDPDAALYWLARMLEGGEDPLFVARRLVRMASEDIGEADPDVADPRDRGQGRLRLPRQPGRRAGAGAGVRAHGRRAEVQRGLRRVQGCLEDGQGNRLADPAAAHPQRPDPADEGSRLRQGLQIRPGHRRGLFRPGLLPRGRRAAGVLHAKGRGGRGAGQGTAGSLGAAARPEGRSVKALTPDDIVFARSMVIHEDEAIIAFDKPPGLSSQGGRIKAATLDDLLGAFARSNGKRPGLVHRLDRDTSCVILAAKTKPAAAFLGKALMGRRVFKTYLAIVAPGAPSPRDGRIEAPLRRVSQGREVHMAPCEADHPDAESASTGYRTLAASEEAALVELRPHTGRMHQLRAHLASIGRPIAGTRYGGARWCWRYAPVVRLMLHAQRVRFPHPSGGEKAIEAPIPADMRATIARLVLSEPPPSAIAIAHATQD